MWHTGELDKLRVGLKSLIFSESSFCLLAFGFSGLSSRLGGGVILVKQKKITERMNRLNIVFLGLAVCRRRRHCCISTPLCAKVLLGTLKSILKCIPILKQFFISFFLHVFNEMLWHYKCPCTLIACIQLSNKLKRILIFMQPHQRGQPENPHELPSFVSSPNSN